MLFSPLGRLKNFGTLITSSIPVAVDFGVSGLKLLHLTAGEGSEGPKLVAMAMIPTPDDLLADHAKRLEFQAGELTKLSRQFNLKGKRAVCAIPAAQTFCKHLQFPRSDSTPVLQLVKSAVSQQIGCHPEALLYRTVEVETGAQTGKTEVICLAAARELISRMMGYITAAKMEPVGIHPEHKAILSAFAGLGGDAGDEARLYLDLGAGTTKMLIAHGAEMVFAKTIHLGGNHMDQVLARKLKLPIDRARTHRLAATMLAPPPIAAAPAAPAPVSADSGDGDGLALLNAAMAKHGEGRTAAAAAPVAVVEQPSRLPPEAVDLRETLEGLTDELAMCLRYHDAMFPGKRVAKAIFVGGEARHRGLCTHIARALRVPAQVADPMARITRTGDEPAPGVNVEAQQPGWAVALGLALAPTDL